MGVLFEGWIQKKGQGFMAGFKKRWLVLYDDQTLKYFENNNCKALKGSIKIKKIKKIQNSGEQKQSSYAYTFEIITRDRTWVFACKNEEKRKKWIHFIQQSMRSLYNNKNNNQNMSNSRRNRPNSTSKNKKNKAKYDDHKQKENQSDDEPSHSLSSLSHNEPQSHDRNNKLNKTNNNNNSLKIDSRNNAFIHAPSLLQLLNINALSDVEDNDDVSALNSSANGSNKVIGTLLNEYNKQQPRRNSEQIDMEQLAKQAAKEFAMLASQNDEFFKEKEKYKTMYDDIELNMRAMKEKLDKSEIEKYEISKLQMKIEDLLIMKEKYETQLEFNQETIDDLSKKHGKPGGNDDNAPDMDGGNLKSTRASLAVFQDSVSNMEQKLQKQTKEKNNLEVTIQRLHQQIKLYEKENDKLLDDLKLSKNQMSSLQNTVDTKMRNISQRNLEMENMNKIKFGEFEKEIDSQKKLIDDLKFENENLMRKVSNRKDSDIQQVRFMRAQTQTNLGTPNTLDALNDDDDVNNSFLSQSYTDDKKDDDYKKMDDDFDQNDEENAKAATCSCFGFLSKKKKKKKKKKGEPLLAETVID